MRVLMTTQPGTGHWTPMVPLAWALQEAGHDVRVACSASFAPKVAAQGVKPLPAGIDWLESEPERSFPEVAEMSAEEYELFIIELFYDTTAIHMTYDLLAAFKSWRPDVVVRDFSEYGGCVAAECEGIPHATVGLGSYIPDYISRLVLEKPLGYLRSAFGLPAHPAMEMLTKYLYILLLPPSYQSPEFPLPRVAHLMRTVFPLRGKPEELLPAWVFELPERPTVYVSMGTVFNRAPAVFQVVLDGLRDEALNLILTVGRTRDPGQFGPVPENVHVEQFIPQAAIFPYCDVAITHSGINTVIGALTAGLPVVNVPLSAHQLQNALRCRQMGVGLALRPPWWKTLQAGMDASTAEMLSKSGVNVAATSLFEEESEELSPESVRRAVRTILETPSYRQGAQAIQAENDALPGPEQAVALLERLAEEKQPILA